MAEYFVEHLLHVGVTGISGKPKVGKSWLVEDMALALSTGGKVLGFRARAVRVLYLALEDSPRRLQNRFVKLCAQPNRNLRIAFGWKSFCDGGMQDLETEVVEGRHQVVIVDTFSRASGRADQMDPNEMTAIFAALQQMALKHNIAIVVVDHHRKSARQAVDGDPIDDIFGSTAKASVLDCPRHRPLPQTQQQRRRPQARRPRLRRRRIRPHLGPRPLHLAAQRRRQDSCQGNPHDLHL